MLVAACLALVRGVNDICKVDPNDPEAVEGCESTSRWAGAWQILTEGWAEARRAATEGFEAIKQELRLYSAVGQPGLVTLQYMMNLIAPLRLEVMRAHPKPRHPLRLDTVKGWRSDSHAQISFADMFDCKTRAVWFL